MSANQATQDLGALLNADQIRDLKDEIFREGTFDERCLRAAAYDLRVRDDAKIQTTGTVENGVLKLKRGETASLETYEIIAMPWRFAGNLGVKYKMGIQGLFVSPGLFVDPGFGFAPVTDGEPVPKGRRLTVVVTNVGEERIPIHLGEAGDNVIGLQFLRVAPTVRKKPIEPRRADDPQGLAFFQRLREMKEEFDKLSAAQRRTEAATQQILQLGLFVILITLFGASISFVISTVLSGDAPQNTVDAINDLDPSGPWGYIFVVSVACLAVWAVVCLALVSIRRLSKLFGNLGGTSAED